MHKCILGTCLIVLAGVFAVTYHVIEAIYTLGTTRSTAHEVLGIMGMFCAFLGVVVFVIGDGDIRARRKRDSDSEDG